MKLTNLAVATAAASLAVAPVAAQAAPAVERSNAPISEESELAGGIGPAFIIVAIAAAGMLALILSDDDDDEGFVSV